MAVATTFARLIPFDMHRALHAQLLQMAQEIGLPSRQSFQRVGPQMIFASGGQRTARGHLHRPCFVLYMKEGGTLSRSASQLAVNFRGSDLVVTAIGEGREAAEWILDYLGV